MVCEKCTSSPTIAASPLSVADSTISPEGRLFPLCPVPFALVRKLGFFFFFFFCAWTSLLAETAWIAVSFFFSVNHAFLSPRDYSSVLPALLSDWAESHHGDSRIFFFYKPPFPFLAHLETISNGLTPVSPFFSLFNRGIPFSFLTFRIWQKPPGTLFFLEFFSCYYVFTYFFSPPIVFSRFALCVAFRTRTL